MIVVNTENTAQAPAGSQLTFEPAETFQLPQIMGFKYENFDFYLFMANHDYNCSQSILLAIVKEMSVSTSRFANSPIKQM